MYEYRCKVLKIVDGDTVDVDIDLGFGIVLKNERVRVMGIDTPESRTRDKVEKQFGLAAKKRLKEMLDNKSGPILKTQINKKGEDMKGKFGRILGDFTVYHAPTDSWRMVTEIMVEEGHAVAYFGGSKDEVQAKHMANRSKLIREGLVNMTEEQAGLV
jgi:micrococcal nuclease|tara:strand:+ start:144 stop:617 length:474 start_codon:yes stop_codon:yes gene_type:complete